MNEDVKIVRYDVSMNSVWNSFIDHAKNPLFMFYREYMDYHNDRFKDHSLLFYEDDKLIAVMPCSEHDDSLRSHGGLTYGGLITNCKMRQCEMNSCFIALEQYCKDKGIKNILYKMVPHIYHLQPAEEDAFALYYYGATLDKVEASTAIRLDCSISMSKLRRRQINKAIKNNVQIEVDDSAEAYDCFMSLQDDVLVKHHNVNAVHTGKEIHMLHDRFPDNIHLYAAKLNGEIIGGSIIFLYPNVVHTQYLCANDVAREIGALDATIDRIIDEYKIEKKWLDFGISTEDKGKYLNEGLINQKEGFGGRTIVYYTWNIVFDI